MNNAGTSRDQDIFATSLDDWNFIIKTNLTSMFLCSREAMAIMRRQRSGRIINISSIVSQRGRYITGATLDVNGGMNFR